MRQASCKIPILRFASSGIVFLAIMMMNLASFAESAKAVHLADSWIQSIELLNTHNQQQKDQQTCQCDFVTEKKESISSCPQTLKDLVADDPNDSILGLIQSQEKICLKYIHESQNYPAESLLKTYQSRDPQLQDPTVLNSLKACMREFPNLKANKIISKYFTHQKRLEKTSLTYLSEIAAIDSVLQSQKKSLEPKLGEICSQSSFSRVLESCHYYLNQCSGNANFQELVKQTDLKMHEIESLKNEIQVNENRKKTASLNEKQNIETKVAILKSHLQSQEQVFPWMSGQKFQRELKSKHSTQDAILAQLSENRIEIIKEFKNLQIANRCLRGSQGPECRPQEIRKILVQTVAGSEFQDFRKFMSTQEGRAYSEYGNYQECILSGKTDQDQTAGTITTAARDAAVSLATMGLGSLATAAKASIALKNLAQLGLLTSQSDFAVTEAEKFYNQCSHQVSGLEQKSNESEDQLQCPQPIKNISRALEYDSCFKQASLFIFSAAPLGLMKYQNSRSQVTTTTVQNWNPKNEKELEQYFLVHNREVNKNAMKLYVNNDTYFTSIVPEHLKSLRKHDLEKFLSFKTLSSKYDYKGIPKEIIDGLGDQQKYRDLISKDGKNVEMSISQALYVLWGNSPESIAMKIKFSKTPAEKMHWESMLKLRNYVVNKMGVIDDRIMGEIYKSVGTAQARVELRFIELLSDLAARKANPITVTEMHRPIISTFDFLNKIGPSGIIKKISNPESEEETKAAAVLMSKIGMSDLRKMSSELENTYQSSGLPTQLKYSVMSVVFSIRQKNLFK